MALVRRAVADDARFNAFGEGLRLLRSRTWHDAELRFRESLARVPRQSTQYNLAFVLYMQHRRRECLAVLESLLSPADGAADPRYQEYGAVLRSRVQGELSTLRLFVTPATASVRIDGDPANERGAERWLQVEPGDHGVEISAPGYVTKQVIFAARGGMDLERKIGLERVEPGTPPVAPANARADASPSSFAGTVAPWIVMGVGGALLVAATVTGVLAKDADDDFQTKCPTNRNCPKSLEGLRDRVVTLGLATEVLLVSGGVLVAGGLTWRLLLPSPKATGDRAAFVTLSGRF